MRDVPPEVVEIGNGVVVEVWRRYRMVSADDLRQEVALWAIQNPSKVKDYLALEERERRAVIATSLRNRLRRYCEKEKAAQAGYRHFDVAWYTEKQIADLLPSVFDPEAWTCPPSPETGGRGVSLPAERGGWIALLADVADAIRKLDVDTRDLLRCRYLDDMPQNKIAVLLGLTEPQVSERLSRAPARLLHLLGGEKPAHEADERAVGRRRAVSNSRAQAITGESYEG